jgi:hypothetical protein
VSYIFRGVRHGALFMRGIEMGKKKATLRAERDQARRVVKQVNDNHADFAAALGLPRDSYGDQIIEAARQLRTEAMLLRQCTQWWEHISREKAALADERDEAVRRAHSLLDEAASEQTAHHTAQADAREAIRQRDEARAERDQLREQIADSQRVHEANEWLTIELDASRAKLAALRAKAVTPPEDPEKAPTVGDTAWAEQQWLWLNDQRPEPPSGKRAVDLGPMDASDIVEPADSD